jgi:polar amino acid transport system substrate-binding protein
MRKLQVVGVLALMMGLVLSACVVGPPAVGPQAAEQEPACEPAVESPPLLRPGILIMSTNATIPPYQFIDDQGNLQGMRVDLGEEIAQRLCLEPEWVNIQFEAQIPGLQGNRWDMINTGLFFTEERSEIMELVPYELQAVSISVPVGNPDSIETTEDLAGLAVAVEVAGYEENQIRRINQEQVDAGLDSMDIRTFNTFADAYQALRAGQVDAVVSVDVTAKFYEDQGEFERVISGLAGTAASLAFKDTAVAETVAGVLEDMKADGTYDELFDQWGATKIDNWENWPGEFRVY